MNASMNRNVRIADVSVRVGVRKILARTPNGLIAVAAAGITNILARQAQPQHEVSHAHAHRSG
jgi:hypothetical protein